MVKEKSKRPQIFIILYNCQEEVNTYEEINKLELKPIENFVEIIGKRFEKYFNKNGRHLNIFAPNYKVYCGTETIPTKGREIDIYGEDGLHEFISLAKEHEWKIYDKHLDCIIEFDLLENLSYSEYEKIKRS